MKFNILTAMIPDTMKDRLNLAELQAFLDLLFSRDKAQRQKNTQHPNTR